MKSPLLFIFGITIVACLVRPTYAHGNKTHTVTITKPFIEPTVVRVFMFFSFNTWTHADGVAITKAIANSMNITSSDLVHKVFPQKRRSVTIFDVWFVTDNTDARLTALCTSVAAIKMTTLAMYNVSSVSVVAPNAASDAPAPADPPNPMVVVVAGMYFFCWRSYSRRHVCCSPKEAKRKAGHIETL